MWKSFCQALKLDHLFKDPRYATLAGRCQSRSELAVEVTKATKQYGSKELETLLVAANVPCGRLMQIDQIIQDPHVQQRKIIAEIEDSQKRKVKLIKTPIFTCGEAPKVRRRPPLIGEHTSEILQEVGYSQEEIKKMLDKGVAIQAKASPE
jgi:crotonobetainyl-CoA:carnitine CoA-transferase CaiB-like acyl-CoA transferase